jgi:hypothetical protein
VAVSEERRCHVAAFLLLDHVAFSRSALPVSGHFGEKWSRSITVHSYSNMIRRIYLLFLDGGVRVTKYQGEGTAAWHFAHTFI